MKPFYTDAAVTVYPGDCLGVLRDIPDASVNSVVTDPPYGLSATSPAQTTDAVRNWLDGDRSWTPAGSGFMGKAWDSFVPPPAVWDECLRVIKPGGYLVAFAGSRTHDLMALAIRLAGFEIRDSLMWIYGSGFPKSLDVSAAIDKAAGAEREVLASGQPVKRMIPGADQGRTGSWIKDDGREYIPIATAAATEAAQKWEGWGTALKPAFEPIVLARKPIRGTVAQNVVEHGTGALNIDGCRVGNRERQSERSAGTPVSGNSSMRGHNTARVPGPVVVGRWPANVVLDEAAAAELDRQSGDRPPGVAPAMRSGLGYGGSQRGTAGERVTYDEGGASKFFPVFKYTAKADASERPEVNGIRHPTVKPLELMRWLVRLVTPPGGLVLDPFAGSGTTAEACIHEHLRCIAIEREPDYLPLIRARLSKPMEIGFDFAAAEPNPTNSEEARRGA
ncbi:MULTISPECIES: site-specific DNA-methyltransferase [unclassified Nocardia]|uniref:DNA-methyltransferase n=1 Tax=unclassified Nocardia TaxID=2637762 RepID=UPI00278BFD2A|nr:MULTISPECIES: site-specific DNA-methyltransferase [unclassified Nocardia]